MLSSERELWQQRSDPDSRARLVERHLNLAGGVAKRAAKFDSYEDLFQVACVGLLKAIDRFDPDRGITFAVFAWPTICGEVRHHLRDNLGARRTGRGGDTLQRPDLRSLDELLPDGRPLEIATDDLNFERAELRSTIECLLRTLPPRTRLILLLRAHDLSQREIAEQIGISAVHVSRLERAGNERLRPLAQAA